MINKTRNVGPIEKCEVHIDANFDLICDKCNSAILCLPGYSHADLNNDFICDNCNAAIAISDVSLYKEIINENLENGHKVNVRGNMPSDTKLETVVIPQTEAVSLAQKYLDIKAEDVIAGYDISLNASAKNVKYQPGDNNDEVKVTITNLNIDPSKGIAMLHIKDDGTHEIIGLDRVTPNEIEFTASRFSTYIIVTVGTHTVKFMGNGAFDVIDEQHIALPPTGVTVESTTNFKFWVMPKEGYSITNVTLTDDNGNEIVPSTNGSTIFSMVDYGTGKECMISSVTKNLNVNVTNIISLNNVITMTANTDGNWTNQSIVIEIDWPILGANSPFEPQIRLNNGAWVPYADANGEGIRTYTMDSNGILHARISDGDQGGLETYVAISNIDKVLPVIEMYLVPDGYAQSVDIYFNAIEEGSGIYGYSSSVWGYSYCTSFNTSDNGALRIDARKIGSDTTNKSMYLIVKDKAGNEGRAVIVPSKVDRGSPIIADDKVFSIQQSNEYKDYATQIYGGDPSFRSGFNGMGVYRSTGNFSLTRKKYSELDFEKWSGTTSDYVVEAKSIGIDPGTNGVGGWYQSFTPRPSGLYIHRFVARIPAGYSIQETANSWSGSGYWLTSNVGTGDWYEYAYIYDVADTGTFMSVSYNYLRGNPGTEANPLKWHIAYSNVYDVTNVWDDIGVTYNDDASATLNIQVNDMFSGVKSIAVNGEELTLIPKSENDYRIVTASYKVTAPGMYTIVATDNAGNTTSMQRTAYQITYNGNGATGGNTVNQIKIANNGNARESLYGSDTKINKSIALRTNGFTNSDNTVSFRGWSTSPDETVEYMAGAQFLGNTNLNLYAVWSDGIVWDVSYSSDYDVKAKVSEITPGSEQYVLTIYGTGKMKSWTLQEGNAGAIPWNEYKDKIYKVVIENGVTNVGSLTMFRMNNLTTMNNVSIASSVTRLENNAMRDCTNLRGPLNISNSIVYVGPMYNVPLTAINVSGDNPNYMSDNGVLYNKDQTILLMYPVGSPNTDFVIPNGVTNIQGEAMEHSNVKNITIPESVVSLGEWALASNPFTNLNIHKGITNFPGGVFYGLSSVDSIYIHAEDVTLAASAFTNAKKGSKIYTTSYNVAKKFVAGTNYTAKNDANETVTTIYYPPFFSSHPTSTRIGDGQKATFSVSATNGVPTGTLSYQWQYRENSEATWKNVTSAQGTGGTTRSFTTVVTTGDMDGYQYRCKLANGIYPNEYIKEEEIMNSVISNAATLNVISANYKFNDKYYETLEETYVEVKRHYDQGPAGYNVATIIVNKDCVDNSSINHTYVNTLTIDTNGHTLTKTTSPIINNGNLIITGSGSIESGAASDGSHLWALIENNKNLTINGATIKHNGSENASWVAITNKAVGSILTVNSGTVCEEYTLTGTPTQNGKAIYTEYESTITINGGTVISKTNDEFGAMAIESYTDSTVGIYIYGGTVESIHGIAVSVSTNEAGIFAGGFVQAEGGTVKGGNYGIYYGEKSAKTIRVNGATVIGGNYGTYNNGTGETLLMSGRIESSDTAIGNERSGIVSIKGGTVTGNRGITNNGTGTVTIYAGAIHGTNYGIYNTSSGTIRLETGTVTSGFKGIYNTGSGAITILGGTIESDARGIHNEGTGIVTVGKKDGVISTTSPVIQGDTYGVDSQFKFYDGKIKGVTAPFKDDTISDSEEDYSVFRSREGEHIAATLHAGWDISPEGETTTAWAFLEQHPDDHEKYKLTISGTGAMKNFTETSVPWLVYRHLIKEVNMLEGITNIGTYTFYNMVALEGIEIPSTVTKIGGCAYENCSSVNGSVTIPAATTMIEDNPFTYCTVDAVNVADGNTLYKSENGVLFSKDGTTLITYPAGSSETSYTLPSSVRNIGCRAFAHSPLTNITLPESLDFVGDNAFARSESISLLVIPSNVKTIGYGAFHGMSALSKVYVKAVPTTLGNDAFTNMSSGSTIYTTSYETAQRFVPGTYTEGVTTISYPPRITVQPTDQELVCPNPGVFTVGVTEGVPGGVTYQWYIKDIGDSDFRVVTEADGTGGTTKTFTTKNTENAMAGLSYKCIIKNDTYPNTYMSAAELSSQLESRTATLAVSGGNYQVDNGLYYSTLEAALEGAGAGEHTIRVVVSLPDYSAPVIDSNQVITLDMQGKEIEKLTAGIENNGTLTLTGEGKIETDKDANSAFNVLILNESTGTLNIENVDIINNGTTASEFYCIQNYGTINMTGGSVVAQLSSNIAVSSIYACRGITNFSGIINISGGTVSAEITPNETNLTCEPEEVAYAIEGWRIQNNNSKVGEINISGTANIVSSCQGVVISYNTVASSEYINVTNVNISGGTINAGWYGVLYGTNSSGTLKITGGTITSNEDAIRIRTTNPVTTSVSNATITSNSSCGIYTEIASHNVTVGTGANINGIYYAIALINGGTYTQTNGNLMGTKTGLGSRESVNATISGGTITGQTEFGIFVATDTTNSTFNVSGGTITGLKAGIINNGTNTTLNLAGGTVKTTDVAANTPVAICYERTGSGNINIGAVGTTGPSISSSYNCIYANMISGKVTVNSGTINAMNGIVNTETESRDIEINGGTITGTRGGIGHLSTGKLTINDGTIFGGEYAVISQDSGGEIEFNNGTIGGNEYGIITYGSNQITMNGGTINVPGAGIANTGTANINVSNGTIIAGENGVYSEGGTLVIGVNDSKVSRAIPEIRSIYAINAHNGFYFYDGILKGTIATNVGEILAWPDTYSLIEGTEKIGTKDYFTLYIARGWDISATGDGSVWAFLDEIEGGYRLRVTGTGTMKSYSSPVAVPWSDYNSEIIELVLEEGLKNAGLHAFMSLNITKLELPSSLEKIEMLAFGHCTLLTGTVEIPRKTTNISTNPFVGTNITAITVASGNTSYKSVDGVLYSYNGKTLMAFPGGRELESYTVLPGTTSLTTYSLSHTKVKRVILPDTLSSINGNSFSSSALESIVIPHNVTTISSTAFKDASKLEKVYIESRIINTIGSSAFLDIKSDSIIYASNSTVARLFVDGMNYDSNLTTIYYPPTITTQPASQAITTGNPATFTIATTNGDPAGITYAWEYRTSSAGEWTSAASFGTGATSNSFTIAKVLTAYDKYEFRCKLTSPKYPNAEMTSEESGLTSNTAVLTIKEANYSITTGSNTAYYNTLAEAVEAVPGNGAETTIKVEISNPDNNTVTIQSTQNVVIDLNGKTITLQEAEIVNYGELTMSGNGEINMTGSMANIFVNFGTLNITSGKYVITNTETEGVRYTSAVQTNGTFNMTSGEIVATNNGSGSSTGIFACTGNINISGGKITAKRATKESAYAISNTGYMNANIKITGGELYSDCDAIALEKHEASYTGNASTLEISGVPIISGSRYGVSNTFSINDIIIKGGTITGGTHGISNTESNTIIGTQGGTPDPTVPSITGETNGVYSTKNVNFYDGILKGKTAAFNITGTLSTPTGYGPQYGKEGNYNTAILVEANYSDGTGYYKTLADAFAKATNGSTITVMKDDVVDSSDAILNTGRTMKLNLGTESRVITKITKPITNKGILTIEGNGTITTKADSSNDIKMLIYNNYQGTLTINSGTIIATANTSNNWYALWSDSSNGMTINNGIIKTIRNENVTTDYAGRTVTLKSTGGLTVNNGTIFAEGTNGIALETYVEGARTINMTGGTIESKDYHAVQFGAPLDSENKTTFNMTGGLVKGAEDGIYCNSSAAGSINIKDGTIEGKYAILNDGTPTITIGNNEDSGVNPEKPILQGTGIAFVTKGKDFNFYDGIIKGIPKAHDTAGKITTPNGYGVQYGSDGSYQTATLVEANYTDGTSVYNTLDEAFKKATSESIISTLCDTIETTNATLDSGKTITLNMATHTITFDESTITNNGTLMITGTGKIRSVETANRGTLITNNGTLTVDGPTIIREASTYNRNLVNNIGTFTMKSGTISIVGNGWTVQNSGNIEVKGGTISAGDTTTIYSSNGTVIISGGTVTNGNADAIYIGASSTFNITGGSVTSENNAVYNEGISIINGGTISSTVNGNAFSNCSSGKVTVNSGTLKTEGTNSGYAFSTTSSEKAIINDGTLTAVNGGALHVATGSLCDVNGGNISSTNSNAVWLSGTLNVDNATFTAKSSANTIAVVDDGVLTINSGTITNNGTGYALWHDSSKQVIINGGTITAKAKNAVYAAANSILDVRGGTITSNTNNAIYADSTATITIGTEGGVPSDSEPALIGGERAILAEGSFNFYDGILKGINATHYGTIANVQAGYGIRYGIDNGYKTATLVAPNYTDGTSNYSTLADAFATAESGKKITALKTIDETVDANVPNEKTFILDIQTYTITFGMNGLVNNGTLKIVGTGNLLCTETADSSMFIANSGTMEIDGPTIKKENVTYNRNLIENKGTLTLKSGTLFTVGNGWNISNHGELYVLGGEIENNQMNAIHNNENGQITLGDNDGSVIPNSPMIISNGGIAVETNYATNKAFSFYDGILKSTNSTHRTDAIVTMPEGYGIQYGADGDYKTACLEIANYSDGTSVYESLQEAFEKAQNNSTISVLENVLDISSPELPSGKTVTLNTTNDGINYTITMTNSTIVNKGILNIAGSGKITTGQLYTVDNKGTLNVTSDSPTLENTNSEGYVVTTSGTASISTGTITATKYRGVFNTGTITISGGTIYADGIGLHTMAGSATVSGNAVITGERYYGIDNDSSTTNALTINGGTITGGRYGITGVSSGTIDITDGMITGGDAGLANTNSIITVTGGTIISTRGYGIGNLNGVTNIGKDDTNVSVTEPVIIGYTTSINSDSNFNFYDGILKGGSTVFSGTMTDKPDDKELYYSTEEIDGVDYQTVVLRTGWNISATAGDDVWAYLIPNEDNDSKYTLEVVGTGNTKDYEYVDDEYSNIPWAMYRTDITALEIDDRVTGIGNRIFSQLDKITSIELPNNLITIGEFAFNGCRGVTGTIEIPSGVTEISMVGNPFTYVPISGITVEVGNTKYVSDEGVLYSSGQMDLVTYPIGKLASEYTIPNSVITIGNSSFRQSNLESVTIGTGVEIIADYAFNDSSDLKYVYIKSMVVDYVGSSAFTSLKEGSKIFLEKQALKTLFADGINYESARTTICYPYEIITDITDTVVQYTETLTLAPVIVDGVPSEESVIQWYFNGNPIEGANSIVYTKDDATIADEGDYKLVIKHGLYTDTDYYYTLETSEIFVDVQDNVKPDSLNISVTYNDTVAEITITAHDAGSGIEYILMNGTTMTGIEFSDDHKTATLKYTVTSEGEYMFVVADAYNNQLRKTINAYKISYIANSNEEVTGTMNNQIKISGFNINLRDLAFRKTGHTFNVWNTSTDGSGTPYEDGAIYSADASVELFAIWTANKYTVTFYNDNGVDEEYVISTGEYTYCDKIVVPIEVQRRAAHDVDDTYFRIYDHTGWNGTLLNENAEHTIEDVVNEGYVVKDSDIEFRAAYTYRDKKKDHANVSLTGDMTVAGTDFGLRNEGGFVEIGKGDNGVSHPTISGSESMGSITNSYDGLILIYYSTLIGPTQGFITQQ